MRLKNKTAVISGATGGIGEATSKLFLAEGANVVMVGRDEEKLNTLHNSFKDQSKLSTYVADSNDEDAIKDFTSAINLNPELSKTYFYYRGEAYSRLGNFDNAKRDFRRALSLDPYYHCARESISKIHQTKYEEEYKKEYKNVI